MQRQTRGYALIFVLVLGVVLASLSAILLYSTSRDSSEAFQQQNSVRALYAAEAAVAVGVEQVRQLLDDNPQPDLAGLTAPVIGEAAYPVYRVRYWDASTNTSSTTPPSTLPTGPITTGPNAGLYAAQIPIQVLASAVVDNARATVADAIRIDLIPVFQFAVFMDGDLELQSPATISMTGRVHANGDFYQSGAGTNRITYRSPLTAAGSMANRSSFDASTNLGANDVARVLLTPPTTFAYFPARSTLSLPRPNDATQAAALASRFGARVVDHSGGQRRLGVCVCVCCLLARDVDPCGLRTTCDTDTAQVKDHIVTLHSTIQQSSSTFGFWTYFAFFQVSAPHQPSAAHRCAR